MLAGLKVFVVMMPVAVFVSAARRIEEKSRRRVAAVIVTTRLAPGILKRECNIVFLILHIAAELAAKNRHLAVSG
jgi:hypothetical protein